MKSTGHGVAESLERLGQGGVRKYACFPGPRIPHYRAFSQNL